MKSIYATILSVVIAASLSGCAADNEMEPEPTKVRLEIVPFLNGMAQSRATISAEDGTYYQFTSGDNCGYFSENGGPGDAGFDNFKMTFIGGLFTCDEVIDINRLGHTVAYFPYDENITQGIDVRNPDGSVMDLLVGLDGSYKPLEGYSVDFVHAFSMLIIKGGKGFEHITEHDITVTLDQPIRTMKMVDNPSPSRNPLKQLEFSGESDEDALFKGVTKGKFIDSSTGEKVDAWFIILPSGGNYVRVLSVTATDDLGKEHVIPVPNEDINKGYGLKMSSRYPFTVKMDEPGPTISIDRIIPWNTETIDIQTQTGINSVFRQGDEDDSSFSAWTAAYTAYLNSYRNAAYEEPLKRFGNKDDHGIWHFTINASLDFSQYVSDGGDNYGQAIPVLEDELDCTGHTLSNLTLTNGVSSAFIGEIRGNGLLANVRLENISVTGGSGASGLVAAKISGGKVENCTARNIQVECDNAVGALAGEMSGGEAVNCSFIGRIIGKSTASGSQALAVGIYSSGTLTGIDVTNVAFGQK